jgi:hypothetical protein
MKRSLTFAPLPLSLPFVRVGHPRPTFKTRAVNSALTAVV